jgi:hypothetical protein
MCKVLAVESIESKEPLIAATPHLPVTPSITSRLHDDPRIDCLAEADQESDSGAEQLNRF